MNNEAQLTKTQAATLTAIRNLPADAPHGKVEPGISYSGVKAYKGINAAAVHVLIRRGFLVVGTDGKCSAAG
jgi:hypothetical protein